MIALAALLGGVSGAHPTGNRATDVMVTAVAAGLVVGASGFAKRWSWLVLATTATLVAHGALGWALGGAALALTLYSIFADSRSRFVGEVVGTLAIGALLLDGSTTPVRLSAAVGLAACLLLLASAYASAPRKMRRQARRTAAIAAGAAAVPILLYLIAAASTRSSVEDGLTGVEQGIEAARIGDRAATIDALHRAGDALHRAQSETSSPLAIPVLALPGLGPNAAAVKAAIDEGVKLTDQALATALLVDPEQLRPRGGQIDIAAVKATQQPLAEVVRSLETARDRLGGIRSPWLLAPIEHRIDSVRHRIDAFLPQARVAWDSSVAAPGLLGAERPSHFLVLFVTPVESRGSGFPGNFAQVDVSNGHMSLKRFGRTSELSALPTAPPRTLSGPADFVARYSRFDGIPDFYNVTFSPDLPTVAGVYRELYPQAGGEPIDGVIRVDPVGLAALLRYTGPITVDTAPVALTADNAADYLLREQYVTFAQANPDRIDVLDELGHATFDRLTKVDLPNPQQIARDLAPVVDGQHLSLSAFDPTARRVLDQTGLSGAVPPVQGDQVGVIVNNLGGNKIDLFLERNVDHHVDWDSATGEISTTTTVTLHNSAPASGLPDNVIGNLIAANTPDHRAPPIGTNRTFLSIYSPWFPDSIAVDGVVASTQIEDELGRKVASLVLDIPAGATRTVTVDSRGLLPIGEPYHLDVWRQSLAIPGTATVDVTTKNGRRTEQMFPLGTNASVTVRAG